MKKQFLILFAFISVLALSQVPQRFNKVIVTGDIVSPKFIKTGSTSDSVLLGNGSARAVSTIRTDTTSLSSRINAKQETLVSGTSIRTVNGNSVLGSGDIQIVSGGGGSPVNIYLSNVASSISGYKNASPTIDVTETVKTITATPANTITWGEKYLYIAPVATTIIPSGFWELHAYGHVSTSTGVSNLVFRIIRYSGTTETFLGTITSFKVNNTTDGEIFANGSLNDITVLAGDYLGIQVGFLSDGNSPARTLTYTIGNGHATHFNTPLPTRHSSLRDKNGEVDFQHLTAAQVTKVNNTSGTNTGDETLTSIKTKLGAASAVSDGYLTSNMFNVFNNSEPSFSKNSGFNLPLGNTPGTVLEGRTFGTAANSAVGDFYASGSTVTNSASWGSNQFIGAENNSAPNYVAGFYSGGTAYYSTPTAIRSFLGINSISTQSTSILSTNYIAKWNGSNFVNSQIIESSNSTKGFFRFGDETLEFLNNSLNGYVPTRIYSSNSIFDAVGTVRIESTTSSNSPTTGALVVGGGIGAGGKVYATGFATASGTPSQYLMADGSVSTSAGVNQTQTTVNGSTSGNIVGSMPFQTGSYKKVIIKLNALVGSATYIFPISFSNMPIGSGNTANISFDASSFTATNPTNSTSWYILEGY